MDLNRVRYNLERPRKPRWVPSRKPFSFDPAHNVNTEEFRCVVPMYAMEEHEAFTSGELDRFYEVDPAATGITNLTIAMMVDFLNNNVMFEICNDEDVIVVMRHLNSYIDLIDSISGKTDLVKDTLGKCMRLRGELERLLRRISPELFRDDDKRSISDIFAEFGG